MSFSLPFFGIGSRRSVFGGTRLHQRSHVDVKKRQAPRSKMSPEIDMAQLERELREILPIFICSKHDVCPYLCSEVIEASRIQMPAWTRCAVSGEIMKNPVMDELGISYEAKVYKKHGGLGGQMKPYSKMNGTFCAYPNIHLDQAIRQVWDRCCEIVFGNKLNTEYIRI